MRRRRGFLLLMIVTVLVLTPLTASAAGLTIKPIKEITITAGETVRMQNPVYEGSKKLGLDDVEFRVKTIGSSKYVKGDQWWDEDMSEEYLSLTGLKAGVSEISYSVECRNEGWDHLDDKLDTLSGKIRVTVRKNKKLCLSGSTKGYNTKKRTITLYITNHSSKTVEILPNGAQAVHSSKKAYNVNLRLVGGKKKIKPGQTKKVKFKAVKKLPQYYGYEDYDWHFRCKLKKKTYTVRFVEGEYYDTLEMKKGKKWKKMTKLTYR